MRLRRNHDATATCSLLVFALGLFFWLEQALAHSPAFAQAGAILVLGFTFFLLHTLVRPSGVRRWLGGAFGLGLVLVALVAILHLGEVKEAEDETIGALVDAAQPGFLLWLLLGVGAVIMSFRTRPSSGAPRPEPPPPLPELPKVPSTRPTWAAAAMQAREPCPSCRQPLKRGPLSTCVYCGYSDSNGRADPPSGPLAESP